MMQVLAVIKENKRVREERPCVRCGFKRKVMVSYWKGNTEPWWTKFCGACSLLLCASSLKTKAAKMEARATELLIKRRARQKP